MSHLRVGTILGSSGCWFNTKGRDSGFHIATVPGTGSLLVPGTYLVVEDSSLVSLQSAVSTHFRIPYKYREEEGSDFVESIDEGRFLDL
jgi:hypothetical protein